MACPANLARALKFASLSIFLALAACYYGPGYDYGPPHGYYVYGTPYWYYPSYFAFGFYGHSHHGDHHDHPYHHHH